MTETQGTRASGGARRPRVAVIGAGMSGLLAGIKLADAGIPDFTIFEKAHDVGGTWRENRYPGLTCDVPSLLYSYSFALGTEWTRRYPAGPEIQAYFRGIAEKHDLLPRIRFRSEVVEAVRTRGVWRLTLGDGSTHDADFVIAACGFLHRPRNPDIEGLDSFAGAAFHSARWPDGLDLSGKRVGVIGTGSTAAQVIPELARIAARLTVFQRTAQWVFPAPNPVFGEAARARFRRHPRLLRLRYQLWRIGFEMGAHALLGNRPLLAWIDWRCRRNLAQVRDPALRAKLTPTYRAGCKRLVISEAFYPAMQRENVELVTEPIARIRPEGVETCDGTLRGLDALVLATGFDAHAYVRPMRVVNESGLTVDELWKDGVHGYRTVALPSFPNFFLVCGPHSPIGNYSVITVSEVQVGYIVRCIELFRRGVLTSLAPTAAATHAFNASLRGALAGTVWVSGCKSWYLDEHGVPVLWPWPIAELRRQLREPDLAEFEVVRG
ncbi:MAG: NAD(P)/FAD-dependent oxidoreductase [bacterium]